MKYWEEDETSKESAEGYLTVGRSLHENENRSLLFSILFFLLIQNHSLSYFQKLKFNGLVLIVAV